MSTTVIETFSDIDMACPGGWENGFKAARVLEFGDAERALSHPWDGTWTGSKFRLRAWDGDRKFREYFSGGSTRYWPDAQVVKMTTRANRALMGAPYPVWVGPIVDVQFTVRPMAAEFLFGDIVSQSLLSDRHLVPWRMIRDGFLNELDVVSDRLDISSGSDGTGGTPEPIIYGQHRRFPESEEDTPSPAGFEFPPIYLGIETIASVQKHVWMIAGHACAEIVDVLVDGTSVTDDFDWETPGINGVPKYEDRRSSTYGNLRRYSLLRAPVTDVTADPDTITDPDACATEQKVLTVLVDGVEPNGDGSGEVIVDRLLQYKHFAKNYLANHGQNCYQSGPYLDSPTWDVFGETVAIIDEDSFDTCSAIALERLPFDEDAGYPGGYIGAAIIGARAGDRGSILRWIAEWNRSCGVQNGITHLGQYRITMLHPTDAIKAAAPLYTDALEILRDSFRPDVRWQEQVNRIRLSADYEHRSGIWKTTDVLSEDDAITNYGRDIYDDRDYPFAPGITMASHLAILELRQRKHPPRIVTLEASVGPDENGDSLGYRDLGDYIRYRHFASIGDAKGQIRLGQVVRHQVLAGKRRVLVDILDCEDLIDFDAAEVAPDAAENTTCATATSIDTGLNESFTDSVDTTDAPTDTSVAGLLPDGGVAYHGTWHERTALSNGRLFLTTAGSNYDTQMAVFTGDCGDLTLVQFSDNDELLSTSVLDFAVTEGTVYRILVAGFGPDDGGTLLFGAQEYTVS